MSERLKSAVNSVLAPPELKARIRARIGANHPAGGSRSRLAAVAAAAVICIGGIGAYQLGQWRLTTNTRESYVASVSNQITALMRVGLGDHIHCAVFRKYPAAAPKMDDLLKDMEPRFAGLAQIVSARVPKDFQMMVAHQCRYHERKFVHVAMTDGSRILSLVISAKHDGESFRTGNLVPTLSAAGIPIYRTHAERFQIASFETPDHLVYVISDLTQQKNMDMMLALAPPVEEFLVSLARRSDICSTRRILS